MANTDASGANSPSTRTRLKEAVSRRVRRKGAVVATAAEQHVDEAGAQEIISCGLYAGGERVRGVTDHAAAVTEAQESNDQSEFVWLGVVNPTEHDFAAIAEEFGLPETAVEDALTSHERAKIDHYGNVTLAILKPVTYLDDTEDIEVHDLAVFIGPHYVITVRRGRSELASFVRGDLEARPDLLAWGPIAVLYRLLDALFDDYLEIVEAIQIDVEDIESRVFSGAGYANTERIYTLKREVLEFKRAHVPLLRPLDTVLQRAEVRSDDASHRFADVRDHALQVADALDGFDSLLTDVLQAELAQVGVRQNEDARKMSSWAAIAIVPTLFFSNYGQNFEHIPELSFRYAYFVEIAVVTALCVALYAGFKRNGWL